MRDDLARAAERMQPKGLNAVGPRRKQSLKFLDESCKLLEPSEVIIEVATGLHSGLGRSTFSAVILTDRRALVARRWGVTGRATETVPYASMSGVSTGVAMATASLKFTGPGSNDEVDGLSRADADRLAATVRKMLGANSPSPAPLGASAGRESELLELRRLRDQGLIEVDEYDQMRSKVLGLDGQK